MKKITAIATALLLAGIFAGCSDDSSPEVMVFTDLFAAPTKMLYIYSDLSFEFVFLTEEAGMGFPFVHEGTRVRGRVQTQDAWTANPVSGTTFAMTSPGNPDLSSVLAHVEVSISLIYTVGQDGIVAVEVELPNADPNIDWNDPLVNPSVDDLASLLLAGSFVRVR